MAVIEVRVAVGVIVPFAVFVRMIVVVIMTGRVTMRMIRRMIVLVMVIVRFPAMMFVLSHGKPGRRHARAKHTFGRDVVARHRQAAQRAFQVVEREAGIQKGAEDHVARNTREAVEIENACHEPRR